MNEMEAGAESRGREALIWDLRQEIERLKGDVAFVTGMRDSARGAYQKSEAKALEACRQLEAALLQLSELQNGVQWFLDKANMTPPWESAGRVWGDMCAKLAKRLMESKGVAIGETAAPPVAEKRNCACEEYWPGQGHHPEFPTKRLDEPHQGGTVDV